MAAIPGISPDEPEPVLKHRPVNVHGNPPGRRQSVGTDEVAPMVESGARQHPYNETPRGNKEHHPSIHTFWVHCKRITLREVVLRRLHIERVPFDDILKKATLEGHRSVVAKG